MNIIPIPKKCIPLNGCYTGKLPLLVAQDMHRALFAAWETFRLPVMPVPAGEETVRFREDPTLCKEEYELMVRDRGIEIIHSTTEGAFRAVSTLAQLLSQTKNGAVPCVEIRDIPDIPVRGIMIPVYEKNVPKLETLYQTIDLMASLKYNMVQLYFDSVVFEYDSMGKYTEGKAVITKEDIYALDRYCRERHIELMANQEALGHMASWLKYDEFKDLAITTQRDVPFTVNPLLDETFVFVKRLFDDLLPHFSSANVHIGMDEAYGLGLAETAQYCQTFGEASLLADYITKLSGYIKETYHKRCMFWGDYAVKYPDTLKKLPKDLIFVDWGYEPGHSFDRNILACKKEGLEVYVSPGTQTWGTFSGRTDVMIQNIFEAAEAARFHKVKGFFLTNWGVTYQPAITNLAYVFGGAFSWNAGYNDSIAESGNEDNCRYRNLAVHSALQYYDDAVLKSVGSCSCADIIYKMGNYYHFEQPDSVATWNGTQLYNTFFAPGLKTCELSADSLLDIIAYMQRLKEKAKQCVLEGPNAGNIMNELTIGMDTVMIAARVLLSRYAMDDPKLIAADIEALAARTLDNMRVYNKTSAWIEKAKLEEFDTFAAFLH